MEEKDDDDDDDDDDDEHMKPHTMTTMTAII
jgi:hypothetical protein